MTNAKSTKRALTMSVISLLICFVMLLGTTFAWFTDSVVSGKNTIVAGNLDVELEYYDGDSWEKVTAKTNVFEENTLWEPGHTEVVYLKVSNLGTLALKYNLGINVVNEVESINVAGEALRLSKYIEFGAIEGVDTPYADRATARAAVTEAAKLTSGYTKTGNIAAGAAAQYVALVAFMPETVGNEANYRTGEVAPSIELGINLMATQYTLEEDSFDHLYDENALFGGVPNARVTVLSKMPTVRTIKGNDEVLDCAYVFETTESADDAAKNDHRYWHADFVAYFDKDVKDVAIGLAGQYDYYSPDWLAFELEGLGDIAANTPVRMLETAKISMNYEELCGIVKKFSCGAFACDNHEAELAGKTLTVELRLYETEAPSAANGNSHNVETGKYITVGTYSHTFAAIHVTNQAELDAAVASGAGLISVAAGEYKFPANKLQAGMTLDCADGVVFTGNSKANINGATVVGATFSNPSGTAVDQTVNGIFKDCTFTGSNALRWCYAGETVVFENCTFDGGLYGVHFDGGANDAIFKGCTFSGFNAMGGAITKLTLDGCTFVANGKSGYNGINLWGSADLVGCTFVFDHSTTEWIDACGDNTTITADGCVISDGTTTRALTASDIGDYGTDNTITVK